MLSEDQTQDAEKRKTEIKWHVASAEVALQSSQLAQYKKGDGT